MRDFDVVRAGLERGQRYGVLGHGGLTALSRIEADVAALLAAVEKLAAWILDEDCQYVEMTPNERKQIDKDAYAARAAIARTRGEP